jgi:hypothetical protein
MKYFRSILIISFIGLLAGGCQLFRKDAKKQVEARFDSYFGTVIADTIIYDVIIRNPDPEDIWTTECLRQFHHKMLIDSLFDLVYSKKIQAFDYFTKEQLEVSEIHKLEKEEFSREQIGKIQFTERWYFDRETSQFQKEVLAVVLGYELLNSDGRVRGYKPVFKLYLAH